ncbi:hypothetical protein [Allosalinactinospora lopnorensis]|uniref:hypothetical protein n=1 Tax=Allosalinactinospora lopnorensis TaxID=1352348 RepID=UPI00156905FE|nr:hypothetical protein [Allosalinactinospora lopnorensis]
MTADERPERDTAERQPESVRDALFAADLKRLVRASKENDDEAVSNVRERYITE